MHASVFTELSLVIAIGAGVALIMRLLKQPLIIGHIITGIIVGPAVLHIIQSEETIEVFAKFGIALLLFIIGLGLNPRVVKEVGRASVVLGLVQLTFTSILGFAIGQLFGFSKTESAIIGIGLGFSSTIIVLKLLSDRKEQNRLNGKISIGVLLVEDIAATLALVFVTARSNGSFSLASFGELGFYAIAVGLPILIVSHKVLPRLNQLIAGSQEFLFLFAIGWGFGIAALFANIGFSLEVGALFAGVALASLPYAQEVSSKLRPLRDFFIVVFFISLGAGLSFTNISDVWVYVLAFSAVAVLFKPFLFMLTMGLLGYTRSTSFKVGTALSQISEFSLILAVLAFQQGIIRQEIVTIMTLVALITIAISTYLITYNAQLYSFFEKYLVLFERRKTHGDTTRAEKFEMVLFGYSKGGHEFVRTMQSMKKKFVVVDYDPDIADILDRRGLPYLYGDVTDIELLDELNADYTKLFISTIGDFETNKFLLRWINKENPKAIFVCTADTASQAADLYELNAAYVMLPHYVGSEKISSFIKRSGLKKTKFNKYREKHLIYLALQIEDTKTTHRRKLGKAILEKLEEPITLKKIG